MPTPRTTLPFYQDGDYAVPMRISRTPRRYPFAQNGDITTAVYDAVYLVHIDAFAPTARGTVDPENAGFYLIDETEPQVGTTNQGHLATFRRTYSKIPAQQVVPTSQVITKPDIPGTFPQKFSSYLVVKPVATVSSYDIYTVKAVASDSGAISAFYPTGGTYTLTFGADTTSALAYNASSSDVQTALNALASITAMGGVTVTGTYNSAGGFTVTFNAYSGLTITSSLTVSGGALTTTISLSNGGFTQSVLLNNTQPPHEVTSGTFTITIFGQTTASIAYNASAATVQSAINALSNVSARGGCTVTLPSGATTIYQERTPIGTGQGHKIQFTVNVAAPLLTASASSLTPAGCAIAVAITDGAGRIQSLTLSATTAARNLFSSTHGISSGDTIYILADGVYYTGITAFSVSDGNNVVLAPNPGAAYATATLITEVGRRFKTGYTPTVTLSRVKRVTDYYLPGITPGVTTTDDIPLPTYQGDSASLLTAIFAGSTSINYEVGELTAWKDSPIFARTVTTLNAATLT